MLDKHLDDGIGSLEGLHHHDGVGTLGCQQIGAQHSSEIGGAHLVFLLIGCNFHTQASFRASSGLFLIRAPRALNRSTRWKVSRGSGSCRSQSFINPEIQWGSSNLSNSTSSPVSAWIRVSSKANHGLSLYHCLKLNSPLRG